MREVIVKNIDLTALTIFFLFFGVATLEAFQTRNWAKAALWVAIGLVFLLASNRRMVGTSLGKH
jgi:hypothetical protein